MSEEAKPKPLFYIAVLLVVCGLVAYGFRGVLFPKAPTQGVTSITKDELGSAQGV